MTRCGLNSINIKGVRPRIARADEKGRTMKCLLGEAREPQLHLEHLGNHSSVSKKEGT